MLEKLLDPAVWDEFYIYKKEHNLLDKDEEIEIRNFIDNNKYEKIATKIINETYQFSIPLRNEISKMGTSKKRVVYTFNSDETMILKLLAYLLHDYDDLLLPNCYAFRRKISGKRAIVDLIRNEDLINYVGFKSDISNFFNSIDINIMCDVLSKTISDDKLLNLLLNLLKDDKCIWQDNITHEKRGVMAGTPTSPFLANLYLREMDEYFYNINVCYVRYSDDIIFFDKKEKIDKHILAYKGFLEKYGLTSNPKKEEYINPGDAWDFLGFRYNSGFIDISHVTVRKLEGKIRRAARSIRRWMIKNNADPKRALKVFNKKFNNKFYTSNSGRELCWTRWFFPLITRDESLKIIDKYMQQYQRYIITGNHKKSSCALVPYSMLKECGYVPLVPEYYKKRSVSR